MYKILLALWWLAWSCVIVPAHTRGALGVDGTLARGTDGKSVSFLFSSLPSCCRPAVPGGKTGEKPPAPSPYNCGICMIVAHTGIGADIPPVLDAPRPSPHPFVARAGQLHRPALVLAYQGRAPPAA